MKDNLQRRLRDDETAQELETLLWEQAEKVEWQPAKAILVWVCDCLRGKIAVEDMAERINSVVTEHSIPQPVMPAWTTSPGPVVEGEYSVRRTTDGLILEKLLRGEMPSSIILKGDKKWID